MDKFKKALFFGFRGAGTSFLINGIANYLKYDTLDDALNAEQLLSPISGTISLTTDDYEVLQIPYGKNQNDDDGLPQYVFKDGDVNVVLIDGGALNKSGIEKFIANGVNMIVLSIPSTTTKINNVFTEILDQIISLFGEKVLSNMFFAFTYTNGSNYSPGEAATVVQNYFYKKVDKYSFSKENCFTFDNECFTQLAAARQNVHHTNTSRSWGPSKLSARRLVDELKKAKKNFKPIPIKRKKEEVQNEVPAKKHRPGTKKLEQLSGVLNTFQTKYARYLPSIPSREPVCELLHRFAELLKSADLDLESPLRVVKTMNASVLSVNIPSGVDSKLLSWHVKKARKALWNRVFIFDVPGFGVFENIFSSVSMEMDLIKILSSDAITPVKLLFCASCMYFATVPNAIEKYSKRIKLVTIAAEVMLATGSFHLIEELRDSYEYFLVLYHFNVHLVNFL
uniref:Uncharacterized protein n=1 Tax=Panagrolaimus superbus TaxID=310955 RepID=A0A914Y6J3_9BILA